MKRSLLSTILAFGLSSALMVSASYAQTPPYQTNAAFAFMMSADTGTVLYAKNADEPMPPSSMGKMMTVYVVFDMIKKGTVKLTDRVTVSEETWKAWNNQGSTMFLAVGQSVTVEELLHGIVTLSGNDACVTLAEGLAGTEAGFVEVMNQTAKRIGMTKSHFANTTGWPDPQEYVTSRDLATLAYRTIKDFPDLYKQFYALDSYTFGQTMGGQPITQGNRNPLLGRVPGADGLKTGHTEAAGYGLTGSAVQNGQRLIMVVNGLSSMGERATESVRFMEWGLRTFQTFRVMKKGAVLDQAPVWLGSEKTVPLVLDKDAAITTTRLSRGNLSAKIVYTGPVPAPIKAGQHIADLVVTAPGQPPQNFPLKAGKAIEKAGIFGKIGAGFRNALFGEPDLKVR